MKNPIVQFLSLVILALVVVLAKTWWWPAQPAADNNSVTTAAAAVATPGQAPGTPGTIAAAPLASDASIGAAATADVESDPAASKAAEATKEKIELSKSTWVGNWGRQLPDPNGIDMDMSQVGKPGGKPIPMPYVAPAPLTRGMLITNGNGSLSTVYDGVIALPDGSKARIDDARILGEDDTLLGVRIGHEILWTDGSKSVY